MELVTEVYLLVKTFPKDETYGLSSQCKRAAVSIPSNIAEGIGRQYKKDTLQFFHIARGSIYELETLLNIVLNVKMMEYLAFTELMVKLETVHKVLNGLIRSFEVRTDLQ